VDHSSCCGRGAFPVSRRELLGPIGGAGLMTAGMALLPAPLAATDTAPAAPAGAVAPAVRPFDLADVKLLDSPFLAARTKSAEYLLSLDSDRLLHSFRVNAGLKPKAPIYGGWESEATWADIHCQGHSLGHYLSGVALMYRATGDRRFKQRADYIVSELAACQAAAGTGLICAFPEGAGLLVTTIGGGKYTGVPWYTLHKVYAGLRDAALLTDNPKAREVLLRFADWAVVATRPLSDAQFEAMLDVEHGGMNEIFADLHAMTGNADYAALAQRFSHKAILVPLSRSRDHLDGLHANTQIPKIVGFQRVYQTAGDTRYRDAALFFWRTVTTTRSYVTGGHGDQEHFFPVADFAQHVFSAKGSETCCQHNMLRLTRMLFEQDPRADFADFYERSLYNGILASQDPQSGMVTYFQGMRPGYMKLYCTPIDSFWCCTGTGMENHAKYGDSIYFYDNRALFVNLFIPSAVTWKEKGAVLTQTGSFPDEAATHLRWRLDRPVQVALKLRHPGWCKAATVRVNGAVVARSDRPGSYIELDRLWRDGDTVDLDLPMQVDAVPLPGAPEIVAFTYGPVVLAGALGNEGIAPGADIVVNERKYGSYLDTPFTPPTIAGDPETIAAAVKPSGSPLGFTIADKTGKPVPLIPYHRIAHQRYSVYWPLERPGAAAAA